jgi:hypothetical protein
VQGWARQRACVSCGTRSLLTLTRSLLTHMGGRVGEAEGRGGVRVYEAYEV